MFHFSAVSLVNCCIRCNHWYKMRIREVPRPGLIVPTLLVNVCWTHSTSSITHHPMSRPLFKRSWHPLFSFVCYKHFLLCFHGLRKLLWPLIYCFKNQEVVGDFLNPTPLPNETRGEGGGAGWDERRYCSWSNKSSCIDHTFAKSNQMAFIIKTGKIHCN